MVLRWMMFFLLFSFSVHADQLTIISPHRKSIESEIVPLFVAHYKARTGQDIKVEWIDQGGTENDLRYVKSKYQSNPNSASIDVFWGGGDLCFEELENQGFLEVYKLSQSLDSQIPVSLAGKAMRSPNNTWYAAALSSFGIFYNKKMLNMLKLSAPKSWKDLAEKEYFGSISSSDPRRSASSLAMFLVLIEAYGWEKAFQYIGGISGNSTHFTHSSSDPIKDVVSGQVPITMAIDFYALAKIASLGQENLGFDLPLGEAFMNADPVGILKGAPNKKQAEMFVEFVLSTPAQQVLFLPKGTKGGPKFSELGRMASNPRAYDEHPQVFNPFKTITSSIKLTDNLLAKKNIIKDMIGAAFVEQHVLFKKAWKKCLNDEKCDRTQLTKPYASEQELVELGKKWNDEIFRNKTINGWISNAKARYENYLVPKT